MGVKQPPKRGWLAIIIRTVQRTLTAVLSGLLDQENEDGFD